MIAKTKAKLKTAAKSAPIVIATSCAFVVAMRTNPALAGKVLGPGCISNALKSFGSK